VDITPVNLLPRNYRLTASTLNWKDSTVRSDCGTRQELIDMSLNPTPTKVDNYYFETEVSRQALLEHFGATTLEGYGCAHLPLAIKAAGQLFSISKNAKGALAQLTQLSTYSTDSFMILDNRAQTNLEVFISTTGAQKGSYYLSSIGRKLRWADAC